MSPRIIQLPMSGRDRRHFKNELKAAEREHADLMIQVEDAYRTAHQLLCREWNTRQFIGGPVDPSPTIAQATHGGCVLLEVKCTRCGHESLVDLRHVIWPRGNQIHTLAKVLRCSPCRDQGKRSTPNLIALRLPDNPAAPAKRARGTNRSDRA